MASIEPEDDSARAQPTVFVSDASAEAERIAQALRGHGYAVVDVPQAMLVARVAVQRPRVILVDSDADGALEAVNRVRELPDADDVDVVFLGKPGGTVASSEEAIANEGSGYFARPVDVEQLVKKVDALTGGAGGAKSERPSRIPPAPRRSSAPPPPSVPSRPSPSLPPPSMRAAEMRPGGRATPPPRPGSLPFLTGGSAMELSPASMRKGGGSVQAPLSNELESLLAEAELRIGGQIGHESMLPSPEEEIEAVLPAEILAALDEPLEDDEEDSDAEPQLGAISKSNTTGAGRPGTGSGTGAGTGAGISTTGSSGKSSIVRDREDGSVPPPKTHGGTHVGSTGAATTGAGSHIGGTSAVGTSGTSEVQSDRSPRPPLIEKRKLPSNPPVRELVPAVRLTPATLPKSIPSVLGPGDAARAFAQAIATRLTGVLSIESTSGARRVVLREGDVVTAASQAEGENLLAFLAARGELPRDRVEQLAGKMPPFGRHAGAALVAHGYLRQDQLWSVLRAHAEWILARIVAVEGGTASLDDDAPGRLRGEPSVFGGSTGAEVLVEVVRRVVSPAAAVASLGGEGARVADGPNPTLLSECALNAGETEWVARARGKTVGEALAGAAEPHMASVLHALALLGVIDPIRAVTGPRTSEVASSDREPSPGSDELDDEAIRARVRARVQLVDEGDYFAILGVSRDATSYEVKRAFLDLRRTFEPSRLLTTRLADLQSDVRKIATVLDEAYEILRDQSRRERYRRAIDASPRS